jgi:outer membrane protein
MNKIYTFLIAALTLSVTAHAQSPAQNLMPDGSHDMYLGLGVMSRPVYEGAEHKKANVIPVMQMQWSNGAFLAGMSAGWHLSNQFNHEFGPLISLEANRTSSGLSNSIQTPANLQSSVVGPGLSDRAHFKASNKLLGLDDIRTRILYGGFYNYQLAENLRQTNTLLFGAGNNRQGLRLSSDLRYHVKDMFPHHQLTFGVGLTLVNQAYAQTYFGVSDIEAGRSVNEQFTTKAGVKDIHADIYWNWNLNSSWLITSKMNLSQLINSAGRSPLVERKTNFTVSSAIAYRF